jgi:nucleoside-diphosphate-sugar epimerase
MAKIVLIAGASGLVGTAVVDKFLDDDWEVIAVSRRRPEVFSDKPFRHLPIDLQDEQACRQAVRSLSGVTHVVSRPCTKRPGSSRAGAIRSKWRPT